SSSALPATTVQQVKAVPGVQDAVPILYAEDTIRAGGGEYIVYLFGVAPDAPYGGPWRVGAGAEDPPPPAGPHPRGRAEPAPPAPWGPRSRRRASRCASWGSPPAPPRSPAPSPSCVRRTSRRRGAAAAASAMC